MLTEGAAEEEDNKVIMMDGKDSEGTVRLPAIKSKRRLSGRITWLESVCLGKAQPVAT